MPVKGKKTTGLYFGSFNPIHVGHLIIANHLVEYTDLDEVWFVISPHNPLKKKSSLLADHHRYAMVHLAVEDNPKLWASNIEFGLPQPSYTVHTLAFLEEKYPEKEFVLIMGGDNLATFHKWKNYTHILEHYRIMVYPRPGMVLPEIARHPNISIAENVPLMEISSSFIRKSIARGKSVEYLLSDKVYQYLREMHFYEKKLG
jgi:nicotinate-nucleotide adenylyltransferase